MYMYAVFTVKQSCCLLHILLKEPSSTLTVVAIIPESSAMMLFFGKGWGVGGKLTEAFKPCSGQNPYILLPYLRQESNLFS